jgi:hypothetical protein
LSNLEPDADEPLGDWLAAGERDGRLRYVERRNGIDVYHLLRSQYPETANDVADAE